jgi:hypothetical protein
MGEQSDPLCEMEACCWPRWSLLHSGDKDERKAAQWPECVWLRWALPALCRFYCEDAGSGLDAIRRWFASICRQHGGAFAHQIRGRHIFLRALNFI